jgi:integrase
MATDTVARQSRRVKLSKTFVREVVTGKRPGKWTDTESPLRIKATATGGQYFVDKKVNGRPVTITPKGADGRPLADAAKLWTLEQAREWAKGVVVDLARGVAPTPEARSLETFEKVAEAYMEQYAKTHTPTSTRSEQQGLDSALSLLGKKLPADIDALAAKALKEAFIASPAVARKAWGAASRVMDLAVDRGLTEVNVFRSLRAPKPPRPKSRHPKLHELAAIEQACVEYQGTGAEIVRFALRLPLRAGAIASLTWGEVDLDNRELHLRAGSGRKFADGQRLPLPSLAAELLESRKPEEPDPEALVFGSENPKNLGGQFSGWSKLHVRLRKRSGVRDWSIHDFRRACVSLVAEHRPDISEESLDRLLTHSQSSTQNGVKAVYQRSSGFLGMRQAADAWDSILRSALAQNVVQMPQRQREAG